MTPWSFDRRVAQGLQTARGESPGSAPTSAQAGSRSSSQQGSAGSDTARGAGPDIRSLVVEDGTAVGATTMGRTDFLTALRAALVAMVDEEMSGTGWTAAGCPWIDFYMGRYRTRPFDEWQTLVDKWLAGRAAGDARALITAITQRARVGVRGWRTEGTSPLPPVAIGADEGAPSVLRWALPGAGPVDPAAARAAADLGPGEPISPTVSRRLAPDVGHVPGDVRLHHDARAARSSASVHARAFAYGEHIAFGAGEYRPGTPRGDAVLAHELAHASRQHEGLSEEAAEEDADAAARHAVVRLWAPEGDGEGDHATGGDAGASHRVRTRGLALRRCGDEEGGDEEPAGPTVLSSEDTRARGYSITPPSGHPVEGRSYRLLLEVPDVLQRPDSPRPGTFTRWFVKRPGQQDFRRQAELGRSHTLTLDAEGSWSIIAQIPLGQNTEGRLRHDVTVVTAGSVAQEKLADVQTSNIVGFLASLEYRHLQNAKLGLRVQDQAPAHISTSGSNPALSRFPDGSYNTYTAHAPPGVTPDRYRWVGVPENISGYPTRGRHGQSRRTIEGLDGFDMGTGRTARWTLSYEVGPVTIHAFMYDASGGQVGHARYRQVMLSREEMDTYRGFERYMNQAKAEIRKLSQRTAVQVPGVHVSKDTGAATEVTFFMGRHHNTGAFTIVDLTPGVARREYDGTDFAAALSELNTGNSYPTGTLRLRIPRNELGVAANEWTLQTTGASVAQQLSSAWGWASLGLAGLGALAMIIPGAQPLAPVFFFASAGVGAASAAASLYQRSQEVEPSGVSVAVDIAGLAGSLLGMAGAANILRHGSRVAALTRTHRFVLYTGFATDAIGGVLMAVDGATAIADILDGRGTSEEKASAIVKILAGLLLNGALLGWGARDLGAARSQVRAALGSDDIVDRLSLPDMHALSLLEGAPMGRLRGASFEEVQRVAGLIRENPVRATALVERYGEQFVVAARTSPGSLEELAQALHLGMPAAGGTRGSYGPAPAPGSPRPTYIQKPTKGEANPSGLWKKIRAQFINTQGRPLREQATLRVASPPPGSPETHFELVIPASGTRPEIVVPVRIESTATLPTSVHGAVDTGPARMTVRSTAPATPGGQPGYSASVEVHRDLSKADIANAVGHELDELTGIAIRQSRGTDITAQKRASLMRALPDTPGAAKPRTTAHDEAAAYEFAQVVPSRGHRPSHHGMPPDVLTRAMEMGFGNTAFLEDKIALLRRAGVDEDMLTRLRALAHLGDVRAQAPAATTFATPRIMGHLTSAASGSSSSPIGGLHLESAVDAHRLKLIADNEPVHLLKTADSPHDPGGGVEYNAYEQWVYSGGGAPPPGSRPTSPGGTAGATHMGWTLATEPKTSFNNMTAFMRNAQQAWDAWAAANAAVLASGGSNLSWHYTLPSGDTVGGWFNVVGGSVEHITVFPFRTGGLSSW